MTTSSQGGNTSKPAPQLPDQECCMCGDSGLSYELFRCNLCKFRSQHRYCSNQYPKAESYNICNWCLIQKDESTEKTQNSSNSSSSCKTNSGGDHLMIKKKMKKSDNYHKTGRILQLQNNSVPIKKQRSPGQSPAPGGQKRVIMTRTGGVEEKLRRFKSEDMSNNSGIITKQVFRNKVRRYKLLDEVSSQ